MPFFIDPERLKQIRKLRRLSQAALAKKARLDKLDEVAAPDPAGRTLLQRAAERLMLSARGYHRVLRVARTLADLEGAATVARHHIAEALSYRRPVNLPDNAGGAM